MKAFVRYKMAEMSDFSMSKHSVHKGKCGEREFCNELSRLLGLKILTRNLDQCRSGGHDLKISEDIDENENAEIVKRLDGFCIEIKRYRICKHSDISNWWKQACEQAENKGKQPMLAYRLDRQSWKCLVHVSEFFKEQVVSEFFKEQDVRGCITMELELLANLLRTGSKDALSAE